MKEWTIAVMFDHDNRTIFDVWPGIDREQALDAAADNYAGYVDVTLSVVCCGDIIATGVLTAV